MTASITTGGSTCLTATFSAEVASAPGLTILAFRALLDGALMEGHNLEGRVFHRPAIDDIFELVSYTFWKCGVSQGPHTVKIQGLTTDNAIGLLAVQARTLIVEGR